MTEKYSTILAGLPGNYIVPANLEGTRLEKSVLKWEVVRSRKAKRNLDVEATHVCQLE